MEEIEHELDKMRGYLMKSTTHCLRNYWKNGTRGKKDFRQHSGWEGRQNLIRWENLNEGHDTPVEWISKRKEHDLHNTRWWVKRASSQCLRKKWKNAMKRTEKKTTCSTSNEFERASLKRRIERSCWEINNEKNRLVEGLWKTSQELEVKTCHKWKQDWIDMNKETRNLFHREDKWRTWVIYKHHK